MKFKNKKLLIFDLDGTLIDSVPDLALSVNYTMNKLYKKTYSIDIIRTWVGNGAQTLIKRAMSNSVEVDNSLKQKDIQITLDSFLEHYSKNVCVKTIMYDGVKQTLEILKNKGYILSIVTNKPFEFIEPILNKLNINDLFSYCIGANSLDEKKPSAKPLLHVCNKFEIEVKNSIMIGDSKNDIIAASNASMDSIALTYGYNYDEDISIYNPSIVYDKFEDILKSL